MGKMGNYAIRRKRKCFWDIWIVIVSGMRKRFTLAFNHEML